MRVAHQINVNLHKSVQGVPGTPVPRAGPNGIMSKGVGSRSPAILLLRSAEVRTTLRQILQKLLAAILSIGSHYC